MSVFAQAQTPAPAKPRATAPAATSAKPVTPAIAGAPRPAAASAAKPAAATPKPVVAESAAKPTIADVREWMDKAEKHLLDLSVESGRIEWIAATYITDDTEILSAQANQKAIAGTVELVKESAKFAGIPLPEDLDRKMKLLKLTLTLPAPSNEKEAEELTRIKSAMEGTYGKGKYCPQTAPKSGDDNKDGCLDLTEITRIMANSRDDAELLDVWDGWHKISRPMKQAVRAVRGTGEQGRKRDRLQGHRRDVARQVRHDSGCFREGTRPALGAGQAAVRLAARLCPGEARGAVRRTCRQPEGPDSGASAR